MRADDIKRLSVEAGEAAKVECAKLRQTHPELAVELDAYEAATEVLVEFWRNASPSFCHAWFELISQGASG